MSGGGGGSSNGKGNNGAPSIPATSRKMVQSLKEIVNCPEHEIYAMLKECKMDPNEAVQRLLVQDTFQEVKSKREKRKGVKESMESRSRGVSIASNRGGRVVPDRNVGRGGSSQFSSSESGVLRGKPAYKKEDGAISSSMSFPPGMMGNDVFSNSVTAESKPHTLSRGDGVSLSSQPSPGFQPAWVGVPGQISMADIVRMGRPKASRTPIVSNESSFPPPSAALTSTSQLAVKHPLASGSLSSESHHNVNSSQGTASKVPEINQGLGIPTSQHVSHDEWPLVDQSQAASGSSVLEPSAASEVYADTHVDRANHHLTSLSDEVRVSEESFTDENLGTDHAGSTSASNRHMQEDNSGVTSHFDNASFENMSSLHPHRHAFEPQEGISSSSNLSIPSYSVSSVEDVSVAVSSAAVDLQQLSLRKDELGVLPTEENPAVIIPNHLQVPSADCSHLSFGSFGSGISGSFSGSFASKTSKSNLEETPVALDGSSVRHSEARNPEYYGDEHQIRTTSDGNVDPRAGANTGFESPSSPQPEVMKQDTAEATHGHQYPFPSSVPGYTFENTTQSNTAFSYAQTNSQMQNLTPYSNVMQTYTNSLPSNLLAPSIQPVRESDIPYSPFLATQSMPTKYSTAVSSISGSSASMPEAIRPGIFSTPQPTAPTLPGTSIATGPALPQHLAMHPYSQPTLPLGHFANMIGYPFLPQSYTYMPSAFQQAYAGNNAYHQSPASVHSAGIKYMLPQYKNSISASNLPQSGAIASGYGGFGSSTNIPGSFPLNQSSTPPSTTIGYDDVLSSQYKDSNQYVPLQQNESSAVWVHGPAGSRTVSAVPANTYYSFQGQSQQHGGYRQGQQPSQHYGTYPNFYHSQQGVSQEHQQNSANDGTLGGSQGAPSKQSHQIWQHSY
ncbi:GBF-interacting protein 1-like isoform X2 [Macadamia integrifolia]|uniref:GBF-interacting protein 1-like isoform X2 n=1 Tax=Macadamia integrifolia TaxID=60698 RepID=UPI001C4F96AC|nr:GBF-interacting protein 1-like isoform X2 [Macadamia integrifolia]